GECPHEAPLRPGASLAGLLRRRPRHGHLPQAAVTLASAAPRSPGHHRPRGASGRDSGSCTVSGSLGICGVVCVVVADRGRGDVVVFTPMLLSLTKVSPVVMDAVRGAVVVWSWPSGKTTRTW